MCWSRDFAYSQTYCFECFFSNFHSNPTHTQCHRLPYYRPRVAGTAIGRDARTVSKSHLHLRFFSPTKILTLFSVLSGTHNVLLKTFAKLCLVKTLIGVRLQRIQSDERCYWLIAISPAPAVIASTAIVGPSAARLACGRACEIAAPRDLILLPLGRSRWRALLPRFWIIPP